MTLLSFASPFAKTGSGFEAGFWIFLSLFVAVSAVHLVCCFLSVEFWRKLTKPFCMVLLGAAMAFLVPDYPLVYISCWIAAVGDMLLIIEKSPLYFVLGATMFAVAHTLNAIVQTNLLSYNFPDYAWGILACVVVLAVVVGYFTSGKDNAVIASLRPAYFCLHFINLALAMMALIDGEFAIYKLIVLFGYLIYLASDFILNYNNYKRKIEHGRFYVMLFYLCGQALIYFGLAFALLG